AEESKSKRKTPKPVEPKTEFIEGATSLGKVEVKEEPVVIKETPTDKLKETQVVDEKKEVKEQVKVDEVKKEDEKVIESNFDE
ncbi:hypothetical protein Q4528_15325, partial [Staphylococcus pasteuri_A]